MKVYLNLRKDTEKPFAGRTKEGKELRHDHRDKTGGEICGIIYLTARIQKCKRRFISIMFDIDHNYGWIFYRKLCRGRGTGSH